jgi:hypothetical protein
VKRFRTHLRAGFGGFSPLTLFASGAQGAWYDPADFSTLYQDSAGTTPVTATGQPVGKIVDKSGRGNHATQATATSRPLLQQDGSGYYYLNFDGVDDGLATASIDFSATDKMTVFAGVTKASDAAAGVVCELSATLTANAGTFWIQAPASAAANFDFTSKGTIAASKTRSGFAAPLSAVLTGAGDIAGASANLRVSGNDAGATTTTQGTGNYGNYPLYIGRRNNITVPLSGRIYSLIVVGAAKSAGDIALAERWVGGRMGIAL